MEKRKVAVCFSDKQVFYGKTEVTVCVFGTNALFPDDRLGFRFAILPPAGQRSRKKHVLWIPFCYLASGGSKISKKTRPGKTNTHI